MQHKFWGRLAVILGVALFTSIAATVAHSDSIRRFSSHAITPSGDDLIFANGFEAIPNRPPVADAGGDQSGAVGVPLLLDGSGSTDPDGDPLGYAWSVIQRPVNSGAEVFDGGQVGATLVPDRAGVYIVQLIVSDAEFFSAPATATITASGDLSDSALIGPAGGAIGLPDGAAVLVPPGALDEDVIIAIEEVSLPPGSVLPPTAVLAGGVYELTPHGLVFQRPAQFVIPYDPELLPPGYEEGSIRIYRKDENWPEFHMLGSETGVEEPSDSGQLLDTANRLVTALSSTFSFQAPTGTNIGIQVTQVTRSTTNASIDVLQTLTLRSTRPERHRCRNPDGSTNNTEVALATRAASEIRGIVVHSTNGGNHQGVFAGPVSWALSDCTRFFAHYYIDRNGEIVQLVDDLLTAEHTAAGAHGFTSANSIGIELYLNVGEPFDGRQIAALVRLVDYLMDEYALPRPQRDPATGVMRRNRVHIDQGGDRIVAHVDIIPAKCDPSGVFMNYGEIKPELVGIDCRDPNRPEVAERPLSVGSPDAPALMDVLLDVVAVLDRNGQHTGIVNTQGGDAFEFGNAGNGGAIAFREDATRVATEVGTHELTRWQQNEPDLEGPGPLIVAPGATRNLAGPMHEYTDVIIAGTLNLTGAVELRLTGSFYVSPTGRIVARDGRNGGDLTVYSRGIPILQGLIDARGEDGVSGTPDGGRGGNVEFVYAYPGVLPVPTLYTRGGDSDLANVTLPDGGPKGGDGGDVTIHVGQSHVFLGGGIGPVVNNASVPPWRSGTLDPALLDPPGRFAGDFLPPPPPFTRSSIGVDQPAANERVRKWTNGIQPGFRRGILSAGGSGGSGTQAPIDDRHGGAAGKGGDIQVTLDADAQLTIRDIDIATGAEIETLRYRFQRPPDPALQVVCPAAGALGGLSASGANGGAGGDAGALTVSGGTLNPTPAQFVPLYEIQGFPAGGVMLAEDNNCSRGRVHVGDVFEARAASGAALYRLRLSSSGASLLGGLGGIPSGNTGTGQLGNVGDYGANGTIMGLPLP